MPVELMLAGGIALFALMLFAALMMRHYPRVMLVAATPKHPCGFVPNL
jgi:hypothetical protein